MSYTISISEDGNYIILKTVGEITSSSAIKQNLEAHDLGKKSGISKFLVDATESRNNNSVSENYKFAHSDLQMFPEISKSARVAILVSPDGHSHDFIETLMRNAGHNTTIFRDREKAINFLLK
ncbi:MAG: hypothetical protein HXY50_02595 [Ignavibacteriaceae bacterium]|nr:hypothetical protein [Ignavibacteriaceae bacterium]